MPAPHCRLLLCPQQLRMQPHSEDVLACTLAAAICLTIGVVRTVTPIASDDVVPPVGSLGGHRKHLLALRVVAREPVRRFGSDLNGADGAWIVGVDGEGHSRCPEYLTIPRTPDKINTISGHWPGLLHWPHHVPEPLATLRKRQLLSQRALAAKAGVALSTVYLLEAGKTDRVTFKVMRQISDALGLPPDAVAEFDRVINSSQ